MAPMKTPRALTENIPDHLRPFIAQQDPSFYTAMDHASWRFILKISKAFFREHAHQKYLDGLHETGISQERIPLIHEMDACLRRFGWRAVAVSGFIPPAIFMEFQSLGILPIACDMRQIEHLSYTPAPDIVHEAAGHAPIIADPDYAAYLRQYGEVSRRAIISQQDLNLYEAIRDLSETKENPQSTPEQIAEAQSRLDQATASMSFVSEAAKLSRMAWWTTEYGLVGSMENPKIYGAGLLSSVGESYHCLSDEVKKIPFSLNCIEYAYDITKPQPQLFVTPHFEKLASVLEEFANTMAYRVGGKEGLDRALQSRAVTSAVLNSGIQIGGTLVEVVYAAGPKGEKSPIYLRYEGPCQLAYQDQELAEHGPSYHRSGFGTAIGKVKGLGKDPSQLTEEDWKKLGFQGGRASTLEFDSGIRVSGVLDETTIRNGKTLIATFKNCRVEGLGRVFFEPAWGNYDLACGSQVTSVFGGPADRTKYAFGTGGYQERPRFQKTNLTDDTIELNDLYQQVRELRESERTPANAQIVDPILSTLESRYPNDWLLRYELLELNQIFGWKAPWATRLVGQLRTVSAASKDKAELIQRGIALLLK